MTDCNGPLKAVHCHIHSVRYDMVVECDAEARPNWTSSGPLRGISMADTTTKSMSSGIYPSILL
eukprot:scaffold14802_cov177-Skeletonema_marinoi.AAC.1